MAHIRPWSTVAAALRDSDAGMLDADNAAEHGVALKTIRRWLRIVEEHPGPLLRGLFHSDGCRVTNTTRRLVAGEPKTYRYPRRQFSNASADIRELCCWALDLVGVPWRHSNPRVISVSRRDAVARLDGLIGPNA